MLCRPLADMTLGDIHVALGAPPFLAVGHRDEAPACRVEQAVNHALGAAYEEAEALLARRLHTVTLAALAADFKRRLAAGGFTAKEDDHAA